MLRDVDDAHATELERLQRPDRVGNVTRHTRAVIDQEHIEGEWTPGRCGQERLQTGAPVDAGAADARVGVDLRPVDRPGVIVRVAPRDAYLILDRGRALQVG